MDCGAAETLLHSFDDESGSSDGAIPEAGFVTDRRLKPETGLYGRATDGEGTIFGIRE
jgi:hypothetical protein